MMDQCMPPRYPCNLGEGYVPTCPIQTPCTGDDLDCKPLAMCYVPWQKWRDIYDANVALERGTIFAELDKPWHSLR